jgi:hypothetical protein
MGRTWLLRIEAEALEARGFESSRANPRQAVAREFDRSDQENVGVEQLATEIAKVLATVCTRKRTVSEH